MNMPKQFLIRTSSYCPDYVTHRRTIFERLFTRPWRPLQKTRLGGPYVIMLEGGTLLCSPRTAQIIEASPEIQRILVEATDV